MCKSVSPWSAWAPKVVESVRVNIGIPVVQTDGRAYGHMITKFSRMGRLPHFLIYGAPLKNSWKKALDDIWIYVHSHCSAYQNENKIL